ncbi:CoA-binding protein [bacterium]|nr:CoA-binding protein [bacterium]
MCAEQNQVDEFLAQKVFAVVGASRDADKYGFKVFRALKNGGYEVFPVNPKTDSILGDKCYPSLTKLPKVPDVVSMIVPPHEGERVVEEAAGLGIKRIWFQPGAESEKLLKLCEEKGIAALSGVCVMVESKKKR